MTDPTLAALAAAHGVATDFVDWRDRHADVPEQTVVAVLAALGVDASTDERRRAALLDVQLQPWRRTLPPTVVQREGEGVVVPVHCRHGDPVELRVVCEDGTERADVEQLMVWVEPAEVDGEMRGEATFRLPANLPLGWHRLVASSGGTNATSTLMVVPRVVGLGALGDRRAWGVATQLYAARSVRSWGMGDIGDLATLATWAARRGAGFVLVNPLHAAAPVSPVEASPYYPSTRRFVNPLYLRVEDIPEYAAAGWATRRRVDECRVPNDGDRIDRDRVLMGKTEAFDLLWPVARADEARMKALDSFRAREGQGLERFATWCALAGRFGVPWQDWPAEFRRPESAAVTAAREEMADRIAYYCWLQMLCDEQLGEVQQRACAAGLSLGVVHDLAVGVDPGGVDAWSLQDDLALGVTVGAPADAYNQQGQDWQQPPWRPDRLAEAGYAPYRDMLRAVLRHAGGLRIDHVLGLFRLWWIPDGARPADGTYVRYDAEAMLGVLALEAHRTGAVVVGEDLGTVEAGVRETLQDRGILGSTVLWFERGDGAAPVPPEQWRELALATVTTHDLPTVTGLLRLSHVDLRERLGLLERTADEERADEGAARDGWLALARSRDLLAAGAPEEDQLVALHALLGAAPSRLVAVGLADLAGDPRQANQPGTTDEYPNWCLPLAANVGGDIRPVLLEDALDSRLAARLADTVDGVLGTG